MSRTPGQLCEPRVVPLGTDRIQVTVDGQVFTLPAACSHRLGRLVYGHINARKLTIACPLHHSTFDLQTGQLTRGPSCRALASVQKAKQIEEDVS